MVRHRSAWLPAYLIPGLHSVQKMEAVHLLQFSGHLLQMLESERHRESQSCTVANRNQKSGCIYNEEREKRERGRRRDVEDQ